MDIKKPESFWDIMEREWLSDRDLFPMYFARLDKKAGINPENVAKWEPLLTEMEKIVKGAIK